ncbi:MAG: hypothetical protein WCA45_00310, partial [Thiobacillaceae bacterium]
AKPESIANAQSRIQIVDTPCSFKTSTSTGFAAGDAQLNRTLLIQYRPCPWRFAPIAWTD